MNKKTLPNFIVKNNVFKGHFLLKISFLVLIVFVIFQLYVLTTVGTKGERVSQIRQRQAELKIENEIKTAKILELQSSGLIQETISNLNMSQISVEYIDPQVLQAKAMQ